ncbi:septum site-determining protein MinC [Salipaludibacillus keqinensis]|uniref:Probable septum site-determining protein MinC n=1 Tax=Salipaludibacillus keqinensis TaxID=2045207 RepID=A0A323TLY9_9BACI|nr:septum site-determining protein MinC [Salipaludibacillus keqinensis]PYZ93623.1 septum site-determining protein MinC [Salipaludibacillus keqinensis]
MTSKQRKAQHVIIKGTKDGLTFLLDDHCSLDALKNELKEKLSERPDTSSGAQGPVKVKLDIGHRYLDSVQVEDFKNLFSEEMNVIIEEIASDVLTKVEAEEMKRNNQITRIVKMVRSGQVLDLKGDLLLIGDVNPGATVKATGNIYILGRLRGVAHAGYEGNDSAIICASNMTPSQLRISSIIRRPPEHAEEDEEKQEDMECAYVNEDKEMILDKLQKLSNIRPNLSMKLE